MVDLFIGGPVAVYTPATTPTIMDSYTDRNDAWNLYSGSDVSISQAFTGNGDLITKVKFYLYKAGAPTGNIYAKVFAAGTGTFGTDMIPGTLLGTSDAVDIGGLSAAWTWIEFTFTGAEQVQTVDTTKYCVAVQFEGGTSGSVCLLVGINTTGTGHPGNWARTSIIPGGWYTGETYDACFEVYGV